MTTIMNVSTFAQSGLSKLIRGYQLTLSPYLGSECRFYPTCSHFALQALDKYPVGVAVLKISGRVMRCHPWHPGGVDLP